MTTAERAADLDATPIYILGAAHATTHHMNISAMPDLTVSPAAQCGPLAFARAGIIPGRRSTWPSSTTPSPSPSSSPSRISVSAPRVRAGPSSRTAASVSGGGSPPTPTGAASRPATRACGGCSSSSKPSANSGARAAPPRSPEPDRRGPRHRGDALHRRHPHPREGRTVTDSTTPLERRASAQTEAGARPRPRLGPLLEGPPRRTAPRPAVRGLRRTTSSIPGTAAWPAGGRWTSWRPRTGNRLLLHGDPPELRQTFPGLDPLCGGPGRSGGRAAAHDQPGRLSIRRREVGMPVVARFEAVSEEAGIALFAPSP